VLASRAPLPQLRRAPGPENVPIQGDCAYAFKAQDSAVASSQHFGFVAADHGSQAQQKRRSWSADLLDGSHCFRTNELFLIIQEFDEMFEQIRVGNGRFMHQRQRTKSGAQRSGSVRLALPRLVPSGCAASREDRFPAPGNPARRAHG